jgi:hypothetical protein
MLAGSVKESQKASIKVGESQQKAAQSTGFYQALLV